jgi:hypothetical protein
MRVKGCWIGGHQQNLNMSAVSINFGPDAYRWYTVAFEHAERMRSLIK